MQTRCIVQGEAQKNPLFWGFSGWFWFSQDRLFPRNSTGKPLNWIESPIFTNTPSKSTCLCNAPSMHTVDQTQTFRSGYLRVGWGFSTWRGGGQRARYVLRNPGKPNICRDIPGVPEKLEIKFFRPLILSADDLGDFCGILWKFNLIAHNRCQTKCTDHASKRIWSSKRLGLRFSRHFPSNKVLEWCISCRASEPERQKH